MPCLGEADSFTIFPSLASLGFRLASPPSRENASLFSDFSALAIQGRPFPAKRNGGGYVVFPGIADLRTLARAGANETSQMRKSTN